MTEKQKSKKEKYLQFLSDWRLFFIAILIIFAYTVFSSSPEITENKNTWINILFIVLNLLTAFYISRQVALWLWKAENVSNQKKIAKTAIRHNRGNLTTIVKPLVSSIRN